MGTTSLMLFYSDDLLIVRSVTDCKNGINKKNEGLKFKITSMSVLMVFAIQ